MGVSSKKGTTPVPIRLRCWWASRKLWFDRTVASHGWGQWLIPVFGFVFSLLVVAVLWGFLYGWCYAGKTADKLLPINGYVPSNPLDAAYFHMFTNGGENLFAGNHAVGALLTTLGMVVVAILTSSITNFFDKRAHGYLSGENRYFLKDHIIVFGANDILYSILHQTSENGFKGRYLIQTGKDVEMTRREVCSLLGKSIDPKRLVFQFGDRTSADDVRRLTPCFAKAVFIIGDAEEKDGLESYRDAYNMDCVETLVSVLEQGKRKSRLDCHILFEYQTTFSVFQFSDINPKINDFLHFEPFNYHEMWAQKVLVDGKSDHSGYRFLDERPDGTCLDKDAPEHVHLVVVGMSKMGLALAIEAARLCHYPNFVQDPSRRTRITFIDSRARHEQDCFRGRFQELMKLSRFRCVDADVLGGKTIAAQEWTVPEEDWLDIEWEFIGIPT